MIGKTNLDLIEKSHDGLMMNGYQKCMLRFAYTIACILLEIRDNLQKPTMTITKDPEPRKNFNRGPQRTNEEL